MASVVHFLEGKLRLKITLRSIEHCVVAPQDADQR
jgi:hypothetical protein